MKIMAETDEYEAPDPLFPLYEGIEVAQVVLYRCPGMVKIMRRWIDAAKELLLASPPRSGDGR